MGLEHFSHEHPLLFNEDHKNDGESMNSSGCQNRVTSSNYSCKQCNQFILHKSCVELPLELQHRLHPKHRLTLLKQVPRPCKCDSCSRYLRGFAYHFDHCNFNLDTKRASLPLAIDVESHEHSLNLLQKSVSFTCDACGKEVKGMSYLCATCPFMVDLVCASLPLTIKHRHHQNPLNLTNLFQGNDSDCQICYLCIKKIDVHHKVYYCSRCHFVCLLPCAIYEQDMNDMYETFLREFKATSSLYQRVC